MMLKPNGSILLDAIIALGITTFLTISISHITGDVSHALKSITSRAQRSDKIIAITNQLQRDLSTIVVIPTKQPAEEKEGDKPTPEDAKDTKKKKISRALIGYADMGDMIKIGKSEFATFKTLNGLTTSPLESFGENKPHFVRFSYKLIKQTPPVPHHKTRAFKLYRKETVNLDDLNLKQEAATIDAQFAASSEWVLISDNISDFFISYKTFLSTTPTATTTPQPKDKKASGPEPVTSFTWPIEKLGEDYKQRVPHSINVVMRLWNNDYTKTYDYQMIIPCCAYAGTLPEHAIEQQEQKAPTATPPAPSDAKATGTPPAPTPQPPAGLPLPPPLPPQPTQQPMPQAQPQAQSSFTAPQPQQPPQRGPQAPSLPKKQDPFLQNLPTGLPPDIAQFMEEYADRLPHMTLPEVIKVAPPALAEEIALQAQKLAEDPEKYLKDAFEMMNSFGGPRHAF